MASFNNSADGANESPNKLEVSVDKREEGEKEKEKEIGGVEGVDYIEMTVKLDTTM